MTQQDSTKGQRFGTRCVHAGQRPDPETGAVAPPIYQTTSYAFEDADRAADQYALQAEGNIYSRFDNPTVRALERRLADLEGGVDAVATGSGMAALDAATFLLAEAGDNIVSASSIYGGTHSYFTKTASRRGIDARFVDTLDYDGYAEAIDERTAYVHVETIANPSLVTPDIERIAEIAGDRGVPLLVDNTFATPALTQPLERGADLVWESTTKWIHGSGTTVGGILVDGGSFPWREHAEKYPEIGSENPAFDTNFAEQFGDRAFTVAARQRAVRSLGDGQAPFDAWQTLQGVETLAVRMERHCENAARVAEWLDDHEEVAWVQYPGLESHETHDNATEYLEGGYGGMIAFGLEGGYEAGKRLCEETELAQFLANVGDAKTLIIHPASTTHAQLSEGEQRESGVTPDLVRLSVGIEDARDIIADLQAGIE
ncbi:O-acetylhomoserine aminocarboxypropyltransferase/cysteine synthase family protein [Halapricum hydrolyticum]|uniref:O-acetylhomoserine aminocarboxypropyltransferase/cysteine synthase n=1 Tax=Halapricum hydrolyticum TaxID=2979991 RepID=A0AAE3LFV1_9EURY|nr:O-acetylhomoserine aminocarboxypropyltransferase/cysteine synthase family protein [Halapricum hydrolyticum]MCU4719068.1 O-acetylhomoserine aminocarboxypropyltransferase/cysteine synthase [Halapricum hydrolyticum]MCU4728057.1 O-acetylhomoserine aminocarboxypropyltransferase/cysteine synthase [Halapricum hydrolyticum]